MKTPSILLLACLLMQVSCTTTNQKTEKTKQKPNVVLIISDDQSWTDYGFMGHDHIDTPGIDQLAAEGLTFTYGYTAAPLCSPALASIATGLYPYQHGILGNDPVFASDTRPYSDAWRQERMDHYRPLIARFEKLTTIADVLGENGFASLQTGKWWIGHFKNGGFDRGLTHGDPANGGRHGDAGLEIGRTGLEVIYDFIDSTATAKQPFFIWYAPFMPHTPHTPPDSLKRKYLSRAPTEAVADYWAMCEWFDSTCGRLMDYIDRKGLRENTLFVYVTDNGWIQDPDRPGRYAPRSKREPYEMGIRTPIIFRWPGSIAPQRNASHPVSAIDIAPTIYGICGIEPPADLSGINVLDQAALARRRTIFAETYAHDFTSIDSSLYYRIAIELPYKLIWPVPNNQPGKALELFDIVSDPFEEQNLAGSKPTVVEALKKEVQGQFPSR